MRARFKIINSVISFLALAGSAIAGVSLANSASDLQEAKADTISTCVYVKADGSDSSTTPTNFKTPFASVRKALDYVANTIRVSANVCLLSDLTYNSATPNSSNTINSFCTNNNYSLTITSADPTTGAVLDNVAGDFGNESTNNKVFTISRGTTGNFSQMTMFWLFSGGVITFKNIILDGANVPHMLANHEGTFIYLGGSGCSVSPQLTLSTNCLFENNINYSATNRATDGGAIYVGNNSNIIMESNATIRNCWAGHAGAALYLYGNINVNDVFTMRDNALITGCGTYYNAGSYSDGCVIRSNSTIILKDNAGIVGNYERNDNASAASGANGSSFVIRQYGVYFTISGNARITDNFFVTPSEGTFCNFRPIGINVAGNNNGGNIYDQFKKGGALMNSAKVIFTPRYITNGQAFIHPVDGVTTSDDDVNHFYNNWNPSYRLAYSGGNDVWINSPVPTPVALSSDTPVISKPKGPISITFDTDVVTLDKRDIAVTVGDQILSQSDIDEVTYTAATKTVAITLTKDISNSTKVTNAINVFIQKNGYYINSNLGIAITNKIPWVTHFMSNGGTAVDDEAVEKGAAATKPTNPTRAGYLFDYWCTDTSLTSGYDFNTILADNLYLYAKWTQVKKLTPLSLSIDYSTSLISGFHVDDSVTESFDNYWSLNSDMSSKTKVSASDLSIDESWYGKTVYFQKIAKAGDLSFSGSDILAFSILERGAAPSTGTRTDPTLAGGNGSLVIYSDQEFSSDNGATWVPGTGVAVFFAAGTTVLVRKAATTTEPYTQTSSVLIRSKLPTPVLTADYTTNTLSGLTAGYSYSVSVDGSLSDPIPATQTGSYVFPSDWISKSVAITMLPKDAAKEVASDPFLLNATKPSAPTLVANAPSVAGTSGSIYLTAGQRYRLAGSSTWIDVSSSGDYPFDVGAKVEVVTAATSSDPESEMITLTIPAYSWQTPTAVVDYANEVLTGLEKNLDYTINNVTYHSTDTGTLAINNGWFGTSISLVKKAANATEIDSSAQTIALGSRPTTPAIGNFIKAAPSTSGGDGTVKIPSGYEYRIGTGAWVSGATTAAAQPLTSVEVRVAATSSHPCSASVAVVIPSHIQDTPAASVDYTREVLTDLVKGASYTITYTDTNGSTFVKPVTADSNGEISISTYLSYSINLVRKATKTDGSEEDSAPQTLVLTGRGSAPTMTFATSAPTTSGGTGTIQVPDGYEYYDSATSSWIKGAVTISSKAGIAFKIRHSATSSDPASESVEVKVPNFQQKTPEAEIDYANDRLTNLVVGARYSIEVNGVLTTVTSTDGNLPISAYYGSTILLRKLAEQNDGTDITSAAQTITFANVNGSPALSLFKMTSPSTLGGQGNIVIPADCEYYDTATSSWDAVNKTVYLKAGVSITVRYSANASTPASQTTEVTMTGYTWYTPAPDIDYAAGTLTGLVDGGTYALNGSTVTASATGTLDISSYYGQDITLAKLKEVSDGSQFDSATATITLGKTPDTPDSAIFMAVSPTDKGGLGYVLVPAGYEFLNGSGVWDSHSGIAYGTSLTKIKIRLSASKTNPVSGYCEVSVPTFQWATPTGVVDYESKTLTGLVANGTYTINGNAVTADGVGVVDVSAYLGMSIAVIKLKTLDDGTEIDSKVQTIVVGATPLAPSVSATAPNIVGANGSVDLLAGEQYSLNNGGTWIDVGSNTTILLPNGQLVNVRTAATKSNPASQIAKVIVPDFRWATPTGVVDYNTGILSGLLPNGTYTLNGVTYTADANGDLDVSAYYGLNIVLVKAKTTDSTHELASYQQTLHLGARPSTPLAEQFTTSAPSEAGGFGSIVIPADYDYFSPYSNAWVSVSGTDFTLSVRYGVKVAIRISATSSHPTSLAVNVSIVAYQWATPNAKVDYEKGTLTNLVVSGSYSINGNLFTADETGSIVLPDGFYGSTLTIVKKAAYTDGSDLESAQQTLTTKAIPAAPEVKAYAPAASGKYASVDLKAGERYSIDNGQSWVDVTKDGTVFLAGGSVILVQTAATKDSPYSKIAKIYVPAYQWDTPTASVDYANNQLVGLLPNGTYAINGATYTADGMGHIALPTSLYGQTISLVKSKTTTDGTEIDSEIQNIVLAAIPSAPGTQAETTTSDNTGVVDFKAGQEYSVDGGITWTPVITDESLSFKAGTTLKVRTAATATSPAGAITSITIAPYQQAKPNALINYPKELLTNLVPGASYSINGTTYIASASGEIAIDETWYGLNLSVVKLALTNDGSDANSEPQSLVVLARGDAPSVVSAKADNGKGNVSITAEEEYSLDGGKTWISGSDFKLVLEEGTVVMVRMKATAFNPASKAVSITVETNFSTKSNLPWIITLCVLAWLLIRMLIYIVWHLHGLADGLFILFVPLNRLINLIFFKTPLNNRERGIEKRRGHPEPVPEAPTSNNSTTIYYIYGNTQYGPYRGDGRRIDAPHPGRHGPGNPTIKTIYTNGQPK